MKTLAWFLIRVTNNGTNNGTNIIIDFLINIIYFFKGIRMKIKMVVLRVFIEKIRI